MAGSNEAGSDLFYEWLDCDQAWPATLAHMSPFWSQVTTWLVDLVVSWADQVSNDSGGSCCAGQHTQSVWLECRNAVVCFCSPFVLNCACPDLVRKLA